MKQTNNVKITALYERLSKDDEQKSESVSIAHQKQILEEYARNYPTIDEAITILQKQGVISSPDVWRDKVNFGDTDLQWLIMKMAGYFFD